MNRIIETELKILDINIKELLDKLARKIAWLLPKQVVRWAFYRVFAHTTTSTHEDKHVEEITMFQAIDDWEDNA